MYQKACRDWPDAVTMCFCSVQFCVHHCEHRWTGEAKQEHGKSGIPGCHTQRTGVLCCCCIAIQ